MSLKVRDVIRELKKFPSDYKVSLETYEADDEGENPTVQVKDDFELIAFDFVSNPSTHGAFMKPMNEGVERQTGRTCGEYCKIENIINDILRGE